MDTQDGGRGIGERLAYNESLTLNHDMDEATDGYQLKWIGKDYARLLAGTAPSTMIVPDKEHNNKANNCKSGNLFFTGDNIEVLRHLQAAYRGAVDVIYIDPPYNTGEEFVYADNFEYTDDQLRDMLGMTDSEIHRLHSINGRSSHSAWLTFMYPRLRLARDLLKDSGVIFISIDDNEQANLKLLCDEVFGEREGVAFFIVIRSEGGGLAKQVIRGHDYCLTYAKDINAFQPLGKAKDIRGKIVQVNNEEYWIETDWLRKEFGKYGTCPYEEIEKWYSSKKKTEIDKGITNKEYILIDKGDYHIVGRYRKVADDATKFYSVLKHLNKNGVHDLEELGLADIFDYPKPVSLIKELIAGATLKKTNSLILDFFAGSGTTAHAVMQLNAEDGGNRRWILAQLDEPTREDSEARRAGYKTIDQITMARVMKAEENIQKTTGKSLFNNNSTGAKCSGFRHYYVRDIGDNTIDAIESFDPALPALQFDQMTEMLGGPDAVLITNMLADGVPLTENVEYLDIAGYSAPLAGSKLYIIDGGWSTEQTAALLNIIGKRERAINEVVLWGYAGLDFASQKELELGIKQAFAEGDIRVTFSTRW